MSEPAPDKAIAPLSSNYKATQTDGQTLNAGQQHQHQHQLIIPPSKPTPKLKKKRYRPPQPDEYTYGSQQAFLDSLHPISIDQIGHQRRCPTCWKPFGEDPDPGFDNSELPVKLHCGHIFGDKCLANTFAIPKTSRITLEPLSFADGKRGLLLGRMLHAFASERRQGFEIGTEVFEKMLEEPHIPHNAASLFGNYWSNMLQEVQNMGRHTSIASITFMENAIIIDFEIAKPDQTAWYTPLHFSSAQLPPPTTPAILPPVLSVLSGLSSGTPASSSTPIASTDSSSYQGHIATAQSENDVPETWQTALANETNLDKLSALQQQKQGAANGLDDAAVQKSHAQAYAGQIAVDKAAAKQQAAFVDAQRRMEEDQARRKQGLRTLLARKLYDVYAGYRKVASLPRGLAPASTEHHPQPVYTFVNIHTKDYEKTSYNISPPIVRYGYDNDDSDIEDEFIATAITMFIQRLICNDCCKPVAADKLTLPTPLELSWRDDGKIPDNCPICHRILFRKTGSPRGRR